MLDMMMYMKNDLKSSPDHKGEDLFLINGQVKVSKEFCSGCIEFDGFGCDRPVSSNCLRWNNEQKSYN